MEALSEMEKAVLDRLAENPYAAQQHLAESLGIPRPTLAMHITQLTRKGYILGRAYVLSKRDRLVCIGGSTVDTQLVSEHPIQFKTSNPVATSYNFGGVARNVAENAARLGSDVALISYVGDDENGRSLIAHLKGSGIDTSNIAIRPGYRTATYTSVIASHDHVVGFSDMQIFDQVEMDFLDKQAQHIVSASWVFGDCNLPVEAIRGLVERKKGARFSLALDGVSAVKATRLPASLSAVDALFLKEEEAQAYLRTDNRMGDELAKRLADRGAASVAVISRDFSVTVAAGGDIVKIPPPRFEALDSGGANDALVGTALSNLLSGLDFLNAVRIGIIAAAVTSEVPSRIHPGLSRQLLTEAQRRFG